MCRHLAYVGSPVTLHELLFGPGHSLLRQAREPRYQTSGESNPDGWGVGWYEPELGGPPRRYRTTRPIWEDPGFVERSAEIRATGVLAAARLAVPGWPIEEGACAPFRSGPWLFSLNGVVEEFGDGVGETLRAMDRTNHRLRTGRTDSEVLFTLVLTRLEAGRDPGSALGEVVGIVDELSTSRLNLLLTDGRRVAATASGNSLFARIAPGAITLASEPLDEESWQAVPDRTVLDGDAAGLSWNPL